MVHGFKYCPYGSCPTLWIGALPQPIYGLNTSQVISKEFFQQQYLQECLMNTRKSQLHQGRPEVKPQLTCRFAARSRVKWVCIPHSVSWNASQTKEAFTKTKNAWCVWCVNLNMYIYICIYVYTYIYINKIVYIYGNQYMFVYTFTTLSPKNVWCHHTFVRNEKWPSKHVSSVWLNMVT